MSCQKVFTYICIFCILLYLLSFLPCAGTSPSEIRAAIILSSFLFTLLIFLSARLIDMGNHIESILFTAIFVLIFFPGASNLQSCDRDTIMELGSQCIVPFFIGQYKRVSQKDFKRGYMLMLLMGIFCSFTHDGISIPLCAGFLWLSVLNRNQFFRSACWPMVIGFAIGTSLSFWYTNFIKNDFAQVEFTTPLSQTLAVIWDAKISLLAMGLTVYLSVSRWGRQLLLICFRKQPLLAWCTVFSYCALPFAPLGLNNAISSVCFFCMFWVLILLKELANKIYYKTGQQ